eukprot:TRINITY_DN175_c0_g3_i3.p1 TRINITY_DN175_c0_g3~~TRINITY_DN175_c0_g3_i3.p1  ORF type:complete len:190 (+),score=39.04 TRINITY_DN175_c0_g3_i3:58-627(+)
MIVANGASTVTYQQPTVVSAMPTPNEELMYKGSIVAASVGFILLAAMEISVVIKNKTDEDGGLPLLVPLLVASTLMFLVAGSLGFLGYKPAAHAKSFKIVLVVFVSLISVLTIVSCTVISEVESKDFGGAISDVLLYVIFVAIAVTALGVLGFISCNVFSSTNGDVVVVASVPAPAYQSIQHSALTVVN